MEVRQKRKQVSDESYSNASVAQSDSEHSAFNRTCAGSNPAGGTKTCDSGCGAECSYEGIDGPCWGDVVVVDRQDFDDGDMVWIHACEGHANMSWGGAYSGR